ncbi:MULTISPECIES: D-alanyl-D-alanine carboxypeptidase family protein [Alphaproteobacteria]|uniref:D-alanyl-D-alanine carboxypeptidase family protein n=1 Tax=Alphaproteobacteria TaxID=28211 RepID=UPI0019D3924F|nr:MULTISPECIES: D-alanyl-D-alanine carboxypeptidase family protein [Alphaproteobacteria]MBY6022765.1 D-alanyl-D-alanine carboxypeptidase [Nitratireductor sp. DP7N14-4]MBN7757973.1 D-alanyl-D-alanine carboxypeptidase [Nitratireductor aquimarinus]MBN7762436.1 D-alanyl-D-alanine carboxypeptidase [Nitratireductor aquibiodomus]MBN7777840.1 D-alanyl-D-alanine carboxypeptidase [Nitratireductor pacificus]MBN7782162.1 D-alanyl-D-alanine carboxypeptidase [Nitratireductor pacificus]
MCFSRVVTPIVAGTVAGAVMGMVAAVAPASAGPTIVIDVNSGRVLSHEDAFQRWYPASITKLMTAYVAFEAVQKGELQFNSPITISKKATREPPSKMGYPAGSVLTLDNAIKLIMVKSANDVSTAIAENVGGSVGAFAERMNAAARKLGMTGTNYVNPHGLFSTEQYTTARDLALLVRAIRTEFPQHAHYFSMEAVRAGDKILPNYNWLVGRFPGADGMKTGYICSSGFNLAATATRNGRTLATIVLGAPSQVERGEEAARLLAEGFQIQGAVAPSLQNFAPYGNGRNVAVDLRPQICSEAAVKARYERGDDDGMLVQRSPYLTAMDHEPRAVTIGLGGATGPAPSVPRFADVPIPTPRPDYPFKSATAETGQGG